MFTKTKKFWIFYFLNEKGEEVITSYKECKDPRRTNNHLTNQLRANRFEAIKTYGYRSLYEDEVFRTMNDKLTPKTIQNSIRYNKNYIMAKDSGVVYDCIGNVVGVE